MLAFANAFAIMRRMKRLPLIGILAGFVACAAGCGRARLSLEFVPGSDAITQSVVMEETGHTGDVALIDVKGLLADVRGPAILSDGENPVDRFAESLRHAEKDESTKAIIVRINSPGGTVTASDVMYRELLAFKERSGKPAIVLMADLAASGGYYLACAGDEIVAHPTTITGSIGVIMQTINVSQGLGKLGIRADAITSGPNKALASPLEPMKQEHRELLQGLVDDFYSGFRAVVVASRPTIAALPEDQADQVMDGRVFTGRSALEIGLVDAVGDLDDALARAKVRANLAAARLVKHHRPGSHVVTPYAAAPEPPATAQLNLIQMNLQGAPWLDHVGFWYVWNPSL